MEEILPRGMGTLRTICHPKQVGGKPQPYPDDAPEACKAGKCQCPWEARWREGNRQPRRRFPHKEKKKALEVLGSKLDKKNIAAERQSKPRGRAPLLRTYGLEAIEAMDGIDELARIMYRSIFINHGIPHMGNRVINRITRAHVKELIVLLENGNKDTAPVYPGTIHNLVRNVLGGIFKKAIEDGWLTTNPAHEHKIKDRPDANRYVPLPSEIHAIANAITPFWRSAVYILAGTGLRLGELLALTPDCVQGSHLYVYRQWRARNLGYGNLKHDREGKGRIIPLDPIVLAEIRRHIDEYQIQPGQPLFYSRNSREKPMYHWPFMNQLNKATASLGLADKKIRPHNFRHFFASMCVDRGVEIAEISKMLGHKSIDITYKVYYKFTKNLDRIQMAINSFLSDGVPEGTNLAGVYTLVPENRDKEIEDLRARLETLSGRAVVLEDREAA